MDTVKINLSRSAFSEIRDKYPERVPNDIHAGNFHFTDDLVLEKARPYFVLCNDVLLKAGYGIIQDCQH